MSERLITRLEIATSAEQAARAVASGQPMPANPYGEGTDAGFIWQATVDRLLVPEECEASA